MAKAQPSARSAPSPRPRPAAANDKYFSKVVGKALDALTAVCSSPEPLSLNELTRRVGLAKTSLFRILHTLEVSGYLERDPAGRYRAPATLRPNGQGHLQQDLIAAASLKLKELNRQFGETVSLAMRFENHLEVIATVESPHLIRMVNTVGRILPPHASSLGKAITAFQPEDRRESLVRSYGLHRFTGRTIVDEHELRQEFERIRTQGFSVDAEESALEGCCFGAPIRGADGTVVAAISLSMPRMRLTGDAQRDRIVAAIRKAANQISRTLGCTER